MGESDRCMPGPPRSTCRCLLDLSAAQRRPLLCLCSTEPLVQVMEENNRRVLAPWRQLYPVTAWQYNRKVKQVRSQRCDPHPLLCCPRFKQLGLLAACCLLGSACIAASPQQRCSVCASPQLNDYIIGIIRARRAARAANGGKPPAKPDILDRVLTAAEVSMSFSTF